ncbi:Tctex-1 family [Nesidiocoris tenuis]|uniref:Tctex-1 family n=1 Tax=Nesidiocoris tenuis TaxID=355587 RepID=A0ABN7AG39_9HEMI|nr:Tctex-1 family [Nesidiocoris tenuis]
MEKRLTRRSSFTPALAKQVLEQAHVIDQLTKKSKAAKEAAMMLERGFTFQLDSINPFKPQTVHKIIEDVLTEAMDGFYYNPKEAPVLCKQLSIRIRNRVKALKFERYRIICVVEIVQKNLQGVRSVCSFLWDPQRDHFTTFQFDKFDLLAIAYVFGVYKE